MGRTAGDMAGPGRALRLAVLIPHRDCRRLLRLRSAGLFASGLWGAWSFPQAAPLALLSAPLGAGELRELAWNLRRRGPGKERGGMLRPGPPAILRLAPPEAPFRLCLYGPALDFRAEAGDFGAGAGKLRALLPPLLGCAVLEDSGAGVPEDPKMEIPAVPGFRAAAVANMRFRPMGAGGLSFSWKIGELRWLPSPRETRGPPEEGG
jgi:hypothetical protein